jgi:conjugal transfer pilus assembly protein TraW
MKKILLVLLILLCEPCYCANLGVHGVLYEIFERSALDMIHEKLSELEYSGKIAEIERNIQEAAYGKANRPTPVSHLTHTLKPNIHYQDLTITLNKDILDQNGNVLFRQGLSVNPLKQRAMREVLLFLDADDVQHLSWARAKAKKYGLDARVVLVNGSISDAYEALDTVIYFDQRGLLSKRFGITQVPAIVRQVDEKLEISEELS